MGQTKIQMVLQMQIMAEKCACVWKTGTGHLQMEKTGTLINVFIFSKKQLWPNEHLSLEDLLHHTVNNEGEKLVEMMWFLWIEAAFWRSNPNKKYMDSFRLAHTTCSCTVYYLMSTFYENCFLAILAECSASLV